MIFKIPAIRVITSTNKNDVIFPFGIGVRRKAIAFSVCNDILLVFRRILSIGIDRAFLLLETFVDKIAYLRKCYTSKFRG